MFRGYQPDQPSHGHIISTAVPPLGAFVGSLSAGPLLHHLGRKKTLMVSGPLFVIGWAILGVGRKFYLLIIGRVITGICAGLVTPSAQVYVSECAFPEIRGMLSSLPALFMAIGVLVSYVAGTWLEWDHLALVSALFPASMFLLLLLLPESPVWLRDNNRHNEADIVLEWLNCKEKKSVENPEVINPPTLPVNEKIENPEEVQNAPMAPRYSISSVKQLLKGPYSLESLMQRSVLIPFGLVVGILVFQQISGIDTIIFYTVSIFKASGSTVDDYAATIIVGLVQVLATFVSLFIIDLTGRKPLLLISGFLMAISMVIIGTYFHLKETYPEKAAEFGSVPVISLIMFMAAFSIGYCNIPFILMGELLPLAQRSLMSSVAGAANLGSMFLVIKTYPDIKDIVGTKGVFFIYAVFCFLSCVFVLAFLPETKQKTLEEIEEYFEMRNRRKTGDTSEKSSDHKPKRSNMTNSKTANTNVFFH